MARLLMLFVALFVLFSTAMARMGLGMWESTSEQENVAEYFKAIHGDDKVAQVFQKNSKIVTGWIYDDKSDYVHHIIKLLPANITSLFSYRPGKSGLVAFGDDIVEYSFDAESEGETAAIHGKFKIRGGDKSWTKDYEFQENGNLKVTMKTGDVTAKITFRPTLSSRAQGIWEATSEGKNLDKIDQIFKHKKSPPTDEKYRVGIRREGDRYVKFMNSTLGNHKYDFKINKPASGSWGEKKYESSTTYDIALDIIKTILKVDGEEIEITYTYDNRGAYGTYKKGDIEIQRFYKRVIPDEMLGKFKFAGKEVNADAFRKALIGEELTKKNIAGAQKIEFKQNGDKYQLAVSYAEGKSMNLDFNLGELNHGTSPNGTKIDYIFRYETKNGRQIVEGDFITAEKPNKHFHINFELEKNNDLVLTYHMDHVVAKRWFKSE